MHGRKLSSNRGGKQGSLVTIDTAMAKANERDTLQYFSNVSTMRDLCTKEQLGEFVELMN